MDSAPESCIFACILNILACGPIHGHAQEKLYDVLLFGAASVSMATLFQRYSSNSMKMGLPILLKILLEEPDDEGMFREDFVQKFYELGIIEGAISSVIELSKVCLACLPADQSKFSSHRCIRISEAHLCYWACSSNSVHLMQEQSWADKLQALL